MIPRVLSIAGFDGSAGAGILADLKTFSALGCYGTAVITALTVQNTLGVQSIQSIPEEHIEKQLIAILDDIGTDSIKIGMLHREQVVHTIARILKDIQVPIVLDPVMVSKSGKFLLESEAIHTLKKELFPLLTLLTPNLPEASALLGRDIASKGDMERATKDLADMGPQAVVVKGGHLQDGPCDDCLYLNSEWFWFSGSRIISKNTHGTGCTFSSAVAAYLAKGMQLQDAVKAAKEYITLCIEAGSQWKIGKGNGPLQHFV